MVTSSDKRTNAVSRTSRLVRQPALSIDSYAHAQHRDVSQAIARTKRTGVDFLKEAHRSPRNVC